MATSAAQERIQRCETAMIDQLPDGMTPLARHLITEVLQVA